MKILELNMKHFGKFLDHKIRLLPGMNIIYGGNETGKTTMHAFIRAMLYGLETGRGKRGEEYLLRQPWDNPAYFAGVLRLEHEGKRYRIERNFYKNDRKTGVVCEDSGRQSEDPDKEILSFTAGLSETAFDSTVFISQAGSRTSPEFAGELQNFIINFQESRDQNLDVEKALGRLKEQKKELEKKKKQKQEMLDEKIARKDMERELLNREKASQTHADRKKDEIPETSGGEEASALSVPEWEDLPEREKDFYPTFLLLLNLLLFLGGVLGAACGILAAGLPGKILLSALGILLLVLFGMTFRYTWRERDRIFSQKQDEEQDKGLRREAQLEQKNRSRALLEKERRRWQLQERENRLQEQSLREEALREEQEALFKERESLGAYDRQMEAVELAMMRIREVSRLIYRETGTDFAERVSEILEQLTEGRYNRIALDDRMQVKINTPSRLLDLNQVSFGTMNQIYFALRMAAGEMMAGGEELPIILDEPFAMYDDERLEAALRWLHDSGRQVILFTCQRREKEIWDQIRQDTRMYPGNRR